jgi:hypothetical protein
VQVLNAGHRDVSLPAAAAAAMPYDCPPQLQWFRKKTQLKKTRKGFDTV